MKFERRPYADLAASALRVALREHQRVLTVGPTGCGKTVIAARLIKHTARWRRVLWLAHRYELVDQAYGTLADLDLPVSVMMAADESVNGTDRQIADARVVVGSVQTVAARGVPDDIDLIVFDEAHRTMADSYRTIAAQCPTADVLGLTATPCRLDGKGLGDFYQHMHVIAQPSALYADGYLAQPRTFSAPPDVVKALAVRLNGLRKERGDFAPNSLAKAVGTNFLIGSVVEEARRLAPGMPKVVFACNVKHSRQIDAAFKAAGIASAHIDSETDPHERRETLAALASGAVEVACNVDVLSEGWDLPSLGAVIVARPTASVARFLQFVGRVQRPYAGKSPIVLDHGANVQRLGILPGQDTDWSLDGGAVSPIGPGVLKACPACLAMMPSACASCPACGFAMPLPKRSMREEIAARLEEVKTARRAKARAGVEALALAKNAPPGWVDKVIEAYGP